MEVLVSSSGDDAVQRRFKKFARNAGDCREAFVAITEGVAKANQKSWGRGVKLAESTIEQKQAAGRTAPLVWTGDLKESLTSADGGKNGIREITAHEMRFGTRLFYARFQQTGTKRMPKHLVLKRRTIKKIAAEIIGLHLRP